MAFSPDGKTLAGGGDVIILWDVTTGDELARLSGDIRSVWDLAFSPDGRLLFSAGDSVKVWDLATRREKTSFGKSASRSIAISPDGKTLAVAGEPIQLWDLATQKERARLTGHKVPVAAVTFSPDGKVLASAAGATDDDVCPAFSRRYVPTRCRRSEIRSVDRYVDRSLFGATWAGIWRDFGHCAVGCSTPKGGRE